MKRYANFCLTLVIITSFSCRNNATPAQKIIGKYKLTKLTFTTNDVIKDRLARDTHTNFMEFTTDLKIIRSILSTSGLTVSPPTQDGTYALSTNGKTLTFTNKDGYSGLIYTVRELTDTILKLTNSSNDTLLDAKLFSEINITYTKI